MTTTVYTDGACSGNPGPGGWAWAVPNGRYESGASPQSTNQRMEIQAVLEAVKSLDGPLHIRSDSTYVVNCFRDRWWEGWIQRGWRNSAKKPVANRDLWEPLIERYRADPTRLRFEWVKGHSLDPMNDLVDRLAVEAARTQVGQAGEGTPPVLGPADDVAGLASAAAPDPRVPDGHRLAVGGHKPPELGGYDDNPMADSVRSRLVEILDAKRQIHDDLVVLSGLGLGAELLGAEAAIEAGAPVFAVLPFPDAHRRWSSDWRARFDQVMKLAAGHVLLQATVPDTPQKAGAALARRDAWLARNAHEAVVVWDGENAAIGRYVRSLQDHLGEEEVWVVPPAS